MRRLSKEEAAVRVAAIRALDAKSITVREAALELGIAQAALRGFLYRMDDPPEFKADRNMGGYRTPEKKCAAPTRTEGRCGNCMYCVELDKKESAEAGPRCKCELLLPCHSCVQPAEDYARSGASNGCD